MKTIELYIRALIALFCFRPLAINTGIDLPPAGQELTKTPTAAHSAYVLVKQGSAGLYAVAGAADRPIGYVETPVLSTDTVDGTNFIPQSVFVLGSFRRPVLMTASADIAEGGLCYTAASGQIQPEPTTAGSYYRVGFAISAIKSGYPGPVAHCSPVQVVIQSEFTAVTTAAATDLTTSEALANAIKADLTALRTATNTSSAEIKVL